MVSTEIQIRGGWNYCAESNFSKQKHKVSNSLELGEGGKQWNKWLVNEKIIISGLARLPEHQLGKQRWQEDKIGAY